MTITKKIAGFAAAFALVLGAAAPAASALTQAEASALIAALGLTGSSADVVNALVSGSTSSSSTSCASYTRDLTLGATGADVTSLQTMLVNGGYLVMPAGVSMGYFGGLTQSALAKYQVAMGIAPAAGYFGPVTRSSIKCSTSTSTGSTSTGSSSSLNGGAGDIEAVEFISGLNNEEVGEDESDVEVAGWEIEATEGSDIAILAVTLDFDKTSSGSGSDDDFEDYAEEVSVWFNGEEVARLDADRFNDNNDYRRSVTLDSGVVIDAEDTEDLVVAVSGVKNLDSSNEEETWNVSLTSIRFEDAQGAIITYNSGTDMEATSDDNATTDAGEREFSFESFATASDIDLKVTDGDDSINDSRVIKVDDNTDTNGVSIFSFELEADGDSDIEIKDLPIFFSAVGADVDELINTAELFIDGDSVGSENVTVASTTGTTTFEGIDYVIDAGDTVEVTLVVDFNEQSGNYSEGDTLMAEFGSAQYNSSLFDAEDENGDNLSSDEKSGTASSEAHTVSLTGVSLTGVKSSLSTLANDDGTGSISWEFTLEAADGDIDFNIANKSVVVGSTDDVRFTVTGTDTTIGTSTIVLVSGDATADASGYVIAEGDDATFIVETTFTTVNSSDNGTYRVRLDSVEGVKVDEISSGLLLAN